MCRALRARDREIAGLKKEVEELKKAGASRNASEEGMKNKEKDRGGSEKNSEADPTYRVHDNALSNEELAAIAEEKNNTGISFNALAEKYNAPKSSLRLALNNIKKGLDPHTKQTKFRGFVSDELVNNVKAEIESLTRQGRAPLFEFDLKPSANNSQSSKSNQRSLESETIVEVVNRVRDKMLEVEHNKKIDDIAMKFRAKLSKSTYKKIAQRVGKIGNANSGSSIQNERRTEAQNDIFNAIALAVAMQAVSSPLLEPELIFNLDKSSSFLQSASSSKFLYSEKVAKELRGRNRSVKVTRKTPQRRSTGYTVVTSASGDIVTTASLLVDKSYDREKLERCEIGG